jgi:hypothetical protein
MVDIHVHILIGDHFIEITLACVIGEEERGGVREDRVSTFKDVFKG